jgi:hypothetical protein
VIEAHPSIVVAAMTVSALARGPNWLNHRELVRTLRRYRTVRIKAGNKLSPQPTRYLTISATHSSRFAQAVCTNLSQVGTDLNTAHTGMSKQCGSQ